MIPSLFLATLSSPALACGGLFCDAAQPVVQDAERIVFGIDSETDTVETHVQISYEGPAEEFAWIVPVPGVPELFTSTQVLFDSLAQRTGPIFSMNQVIEGSCKTGRGLFAGVPDSRNVASSSGVKTGSTTSGGVQVISQEQVGPYDTEVLAADSDAALLAYLETNGYDLPAGIEGVLSPYVSAGAHFVALKLAKDKDAGDLAPLGMRYPGDRAMIPIQLTSIATAPDLRLEVYVFADHRAVPESYLHVQINEAAIDWWTFGSNYADVITRAADEAGGHAFATDFFGPTAPLAVDYDFDPDHLAVQPDARSWVLELREQDVPLSDALAQLLADHIDLPSGVEPLAFLQCPDCYSGWNTTSFDAVAATADLQERILIPLEDTEALYARPLLSRMTSSLSAIEMTVDPVFVLNPDMSRPSDYVEQRHTADLVYECSSRVTLDEANRRLELSDGRSLKLPSESWFANTPMTELEYLEEHGALAAQVIEATGAEGQPEVLTDHTDMLFDLAELHNQLFKGVPGCGCSSSGAPTSLATVGLLGLLGLGIRRRRQG